MEFIKCLKVLFQKFLTLGTPSEKDVLYSEVIQKKSPKESTEKHMIQAALGTIGHTLKNSMSIVGQEESVEFTRGTSTPPPKIATKPKPVKKKSAAKKLKAKKMTTSTKKTATTKKETPIKKTATKKSTAKTKANTTKVEADKKPVAKKSAPTKSETKTTTKKITEKKTGTTTANAKTTVKTAPKKTVAKKSSAKAVTTKKAEKIALYTKDIQKHYGEVDNDFLAIIVKNLGPSIYKKDAELVSCSDPKELDTVRKNFLMKKLGIDASKKVLDAAIEDVCEELKSTRKKYRATFYYRLAKKFKKESVLS